MCELFGLASAKTVRCNAMLREFYDHSHHHNHGWGIAFFDGELHMEKEPVPAYESPRVAELLSAPIDAAHMMAHIRLASVGSLSRANSHPFVKTDRWGRVWTLEHNGTLFDGHLVEAYKPVQEGQTDSERIACCLIDRINRLPAAPDDAQRFALVDRLIRDITPGNKVNLLIWDGAYLYVHTNLIATLYRKALPEGVVIATTPLDDGAWEQVPMMRLLVYRDGEIVYEGGCHGNEYHPKD